MPGASGQATFAIGRENLRIPSGSAAASNWAPNTRLQLSNPARLLLQEVHRDDPPLAESALGGDGACRRDPRRCCPGRCDGRADAAEIYTR